MSRLSHEQITKLLDDANHYDAVRKRSAVDNLRLAIRNAYLEADAADELKVIVNEQVRKIVRLEVEIGDLKERLQVKAEREPWEPAQEPGSLVEPAAPERTVFVKKKQIG